MPVPRAQVRANLVQLLQYQLAREREYGPLLLAVWVNIRDEAEDAFLLWVFERFASPEGGGRRSIIAFRGPGNDRYEGLSVARRCEIHGGGAAGRDALRGQMPASCAPPRWSTPQPDARRRTSGYARDLRSSPRTTPSHQGDGGGARSALPRAESVTAVAPGTHGSHCR